MFISWYDKVYGTDIEPDFSVPFSNSGSGMKDEFILADDNGVMDLKKIGATNLYEEIQSHKDSVDIHQMLERYKAGDTAALDRIKGAYVDLLNAPKSLAEMYGFINNAKAYFDQLPLEVREHYNLNASEFIKDFGSETFKTLFTPRFGDLDYIEIESKKKAAEIEKSMIEPPIGKPLDPKPVKESVENA